MADKIPVYFEYEGKEHKGILESVQGGGSGSIFHLMVGRYYWGRLRRVNDEWVFDPTPKDQTLKEKAAELGNFVELWVQ